MVEDMAVVIAMDIKNQKMEEVSVEADSVKRKNTFDLMEHQPKVPEMDTVMAMDTVLHLKADSEAQDSNKYEIIRFHQSTYPTLHAPRPLTHFQFLLCWMKYHGS